MMWSNKAFGIYMGLHDTMRAAEFEPTRLREEQLGTLADTQCVQATEERTRSAARQAYGSATLNGHSMDRRPARG